MRHNMRFKNGRLTIFSCKGNTSANKTNLSQCHIFWSENISHVLKYIHALNSANLSFAYKLGRCLKQPQFS